MTISEIVKCPECWKPQTLCVCGDIRPLKAQTQLLILQHPQESRNPYSTARLLSLSLPNAIHRVGFSWGSLKRAVGNDINPKEWAVLFLGTNKGKKDSAKPVSLTDSRGKPAPLDGLRGLIVLDGNWKQSKALWWRNSWLIRLQRITLNTKTPSLFGTVRKQPRDECLCTLESVVEVFKALGEDNGLTTALMGMLEKHVGRVKAGAN